MPQLLQLSLIFAGRGWGEGREDMSFSSLRRGKMPTVVMWQGDRRSRSSNVKTRGKNSCHCLRYHHIMFQCPPASGVCTRYLRYLRPGTCGVQGSSGCIEACKRRQPGEAMESQTIDVYLGTLPITVDGAGRQASFRVFGNPRGGWRALQWQEASRAYLPLPRTVLSEIGGGDRRIAD